MVSLYKLKQEDLHIDTLQTVLMQTSAIRAMSIGQFCCETFAAYHPVLYRNRYVSHYDPRLTCLDMATSHQKHYQDDSLSLHNVRTSQRQDRRKLNLMSTSGGQSLICPNLEAFAHLAPFSGLPTFRNAGRGLRGRKQRHERGLYCSA